MAKERQKPGCVTAGGGLAFSFGGALPEALLRRVATMVQGQSSAWVKARRRRRARRAAPRGSAGPGRCKAAKLRVNGLATARFRGRFWAHTCDVASGLLDTLASKNDGLSSTVDVCTWFCSSVSPGDSFQSSAAVLHPTTRLDAPEPNHIGQATCRRADGASITVIRTAVTSFHRRDSDQKT